MINYFSSVFNETEESPLEESFDNSGKSVEIIEAFQELFTLLKELSRRDKERPPAKAREELLVGQKSAKFESIFTKIIDILKAESERWAVESMRCEDTNIIDVPCADALIMCQGLRKLCMFASEDSPRGCLPLTLSSIASLLRIVKYPLLPHKSIHEPISRLIFVGARYDKFIGSVLALSTGLTQLEQLEYQVKIDAGMASLIHAIWTKIMENRVILEFFSRDGYSSEDEDEDEDEDEGEGDDQEREGKEERKDKSVVEFDIISAIIPIMGSRQVGFICKESLLHALSMRSPLIDRFVASHTSVMADAVTELSRKYYAALTALTDSCRRIDRQTGYSADMAMLLGAENDEDVSSFLPLLLSPLKKLPVFGSAETEDVDALRERESAPKEEDSEGTNIDMLTQATSVLSNYLFRTPQKGSPGSPSRSSDSENNSEGAFPQGSQQQSDRAEAMQALMRLLHFCDAVLVSVSDTPVGANISLRASFELELRSGFLETVLLPSLRGRLTCIDADEGDNQVASAAYLILRQVVRQLSAANSAQSGVLSVLLPFLTEALCEEGLKDGPLSLLDELLTRSLSQSSVVATSSASVLAIILDALPLTDAFALLLERLVSPSHATREDSGSKRRTKEEDEEEDSTEGEEDEEEGDALLNIQPLMHPLLLQCKAGGPCPDSLRRMLPHFQQEQDEEQNSDWASILTPSEALQECISLQTSKLALRIAYSRGRGAETRDFPSAGEDWSGTLMEFLVSRVQGFQHRRFEEKVALSSLVERAACVCLVMVILSSATASPPGSGSKALFAVARLYIAIDAMCGQVMQAARKCGAVSEDNLQAVRRILSCGNASGDGLPGDISESSRLLLETAVLAAEMRHEIRTLFIAASQLTEEGALSYSMGVREAMSREDERQEESDSEEDDPILPMELSVLSDIESREQDVLENRTTSISPYLLKGREQRGGNREGLSSPRRGGADMMESNFLSELSELQDGLNSLVTAI